MKHRGMTDDAPFYAFETTPITTTTDRYIRCDEPSIEQLGDGRWLFLYANHEGRSDNDRSDIIALVLEADGTPTGETWTAVKAPPKGMNSMSPAVRRLPGGRLGMLFSYRESVQVASRRFTASTDEGRTWSDPVLVAGETADGNYKTGRHDSFLVHSSGRLLAPCHCSDDWDKHHLDVRVSRSDDGGRSWTLSDRIELPYVGWLGREKRGMESGCIEPYAVERKDGSILMTIRTAMGTQFYSISNDAGATWSEPTSLEVTSPVAPAALLAVPDGTDRFLMTWTCNYEAKAGGCGRRKNISLALSEPGGTVWPHHQRKTLIEETSQTVDYPFLRWVDDEIWVIYRHSTGPGTLQGRTSTRLMKVPADWILG